MLQTISASISFIWSALYFSLYFSYKTGKFFITTINVLLEYAFIVINNVAEISVAIFEAFTIFYQDILQCLQQLYSVCFFLIERGTSGISTLLYGLSHIVETILLYIVTLYNVVINSVLNMATVVGQIFVFLKRFLVLFGSGVWFVATLIPVLFVYLGTLCVYYSGVILEEIVDSVFTSAKITKTALKNVLEFFTDVPMESAAGIIIAICLAYIATQFYIVLYSYMQEQLRNVFRRVSYRYNNLRTVQRRQATQASLAPRLTPKSRPHIRKKLNVPESPTNEFQIDDRYCVICQEKVKCILLLPCRHMCMCDECSRRLQLYNNTCPICRNHIESTMKIFV